MRMRYVVWLAGALSVGRVAAADSRCMYAGQAGEEAEPGVVQPHVERD